MLAYGFIILAVAVRFIPHPFNATPLMASLLYFGARGPRRQWWVPLAVFAASDFILTKFVYSYAFTWDHLVTFAWYGGILWLGTKLREHVRPLPVVGASLTGSISFFVISNFAAWAAWTDMYPRTFMGLLTAYAAGLPFFRRGVQGDLFFTCVMFGLPALAGLFANSLHGAGDRSAEA